MDGAVRSQEDPARRRGVVGAVGVHHDAHPRPEGLAYGAHVLDVHVHAEAYLELYGPETFGDVPLRLANAGLGGVFPLPAVEPGWAPVLLSADGLLTTT